MSGKEGAGGGKRFEEETEDREVSRYKDGQLLDKAGDGEAFVNEEQGKN